MPENEPKNPDEPVVPILEDEDFAGFMLSGNTARKGVQKSAREVEEGQDILPELLELAVDNEPHYHITETGEVKPLQEKEKDKDKRTDNDLAR